MDEAQAASGGWGKGLARSRVSAVRFVPWICCHSSLSQTGCIAGWAGGWSWGRTPATRLEVPSLHSRDRGGNTSTPQRNLLAPPHDAGASPGAAPHEPRLMQERHSPGGVWALYKGQGEIAPQLAGVTGKCSRTKRHRRSGEGAESLACHLS